MLVKKKIYMIYGKILKIEFINYWREEQTFASLEALVAQLHRDQEALEALLKQG